MNELAEKVTYEEVPHSRPARRWLYKLSRPVRFTQGFDKEYSDGECTTEHVVVSWGRDGDTCIFPGDEDGRILDMLGWVGRDYWVPASEFVGEWLGMRSEKDFA